jgi:predicted dehydrogenase
VIEDLRPLGRPTSPGERPVRIGVIGLGYWGPNLVRNLHALPAADVACVCDVRADALAPIALRYPALAQTNRVEEVLEDPAVEAVAIATPVSTHFELAAAALRAGKHVFVEKPLAASSEGALDLIRLAERDGLVLMPGHTFLYSPPVNLVRELIDSGELGEIYFISTSRVNLGLHQPDVSVIWDLGAHDLSILRYWLGEMPAEVSATSRGCIIPGTPDVAFISLRFASETIAHVELSWLAPSKLRRTAIVGSQKMVVYDDTSNEPVRVFDSGVTAPVPETFGEYRLTYRTGDIVSPRVDVLEPLSLELDDFCGSVRGRSEPRSSAAIGLDVVRMIEAVDRSLALRGTPVETTTLAAPAR